MIIAQGAEAKINRNKELIIKERVKKGYRINEIDEKLRKQRTRKEAKLLEKASKILNVPRIIKVNEKRHLIEMDFIEGKKLSEWLDKLDNSFEICRKVGENIAILHDSGIIHGDLTTSNMILREGKVYFIDFGLGFESKKTEDKAVDLHLIKEALEAKHFVHFKEYFDNILKGYAKSKSFDEVIKRLERVEKRGRYKNNY